jgi:hypothetical protein
LPECFYALFILLLVYAAMNKLLDYSMFKIELSKSPILTSYASFISWGIPVIEFVIAFMLCFNITRLIGLYVFVSLMTMFTTYIYYILNYSPFVPCSCGGVLENMSWNQHFLFNVTFILIACLSVILYPRYKNKHTAVSEGKSFPL